MGDPTRDESEPTLELPSLFRRKRRGATDPEPRQTAAERSEPRPEPRPEPAAEAAPEPDPEVEQSPPTPEPLDVAQPTPKEPAPPPADDAATGQETTPEPAAPPPPRAPVPAPASPARPRRARPPLGTGPRLSATVAAPLTGLVVGLLGVLLTYGGLRGCELVRGADSCGGGPGLLLLVAILAAMVLAGTALLTWLHVPEPRSTSFLGVGVTAVVAMVALLEAVFSAWMFVVVPLVTAAAYLLAWWVTSRIVEQLDDGPGVDVR